jgi:hypothetical protein
MYLRLSIYIYSKAHVKEKKTLFLILFVLFIFSYFNVTLFCLLYFNDNSILENLIKNYFTTRK